MTHVYGRWKRPAAGLLTVFLLILGGTPALAAPHSTTSVKTAEGPYESYTYWEDYGAAEKTPVYGKPMYTVKTVLSAPTLGIGTLEDVADICTDENGRVYILDSGASKIYILDSAYRLVARIEAIVDQGEPLSVEGASGIFVKAGTIYLADTKQARILMLGMDGVVTRKLPVPDSKLIPTDFVYRPVKVAVDSKDYTYIASDGAYYGALVYSPAMEFLGFYGANTVKVGFLHALGNLMDRLFTNDVKKGASILALPYQFNDLVAGPHDFIYTATGRTDGQSQQTGQVCMMNPGGKNVLGKEAYNFADVQVGVYKRMQQTQSIVGIDVDDDGFFYIVDATYGRVFWYDKDCHVLSVFGGGMGSDQQKGTLLLANAIAVNGTDVLVSDGMKNTITVFQITDYGRLVRDTQRKTLEDDFEDTAEAWNQVIAQDRNSQLGYRGLAKAHYAQGDYAATAAYARLGADRETYSRAFVKNRLAFLETWFPLLFGGVLALAAGLTAFVIVKRKKHIRLITNERVRTVTASVAHPFEAFRLVKERGRGSVGIACVLLAAYYLVAALTDTLEGFAFNTFDAAHYNAFYVLLSTVGLVLLWTVANWLVCVLLGGIGRLKEIFIVTCYSLIPTVFASLVSLIGTHVLVPEEFVFIQILQTVCTLYTLFMLMVGTMKVHDFEFGKFVTTSLLTLIVMMILVFLLFLVFLLSQQTFGWVSTLIVEATYR